jgi:hypothetical protein
MTVHVDSLYDAGSQKFSVTISPSADGRVRGFVSLPVFDSHTQALRGGLNYLENIGVRINWNADALLLL